MKRNRCAICKEDSEYLEVHHIIPVSRGGSDEQDNLITLCSSCHGKAHDVSFSKDRGGLVKEGVDKKIRNCKIDREWLEDNETLVNDKLNNLYIQDENQYIFVLYLLESSRLTASHLRQWTEKGKVTLKTSITLW